ncbi:uncharacterized protein LOC135285788 isoform X2 [Passer domesticus]
MAEAALAEAQAVLGTSLHSGLLLDPGTGKKGYELKRILAASLKENLKDLQQVRNSSAEQGSEVVAVLCPCSSTEDAEPLWAIFIFSAQLQLPSFCKPLKTCYDLGVG